MLTAIEIRNAVGIHVLSLPVAGSIGIIPYLVKDVEGLGPVKANITTATFASYDGGSVQATRTGMRNIVFKIGYQPDYVLGRSVQTLRRELYTFFPPKGEISLRFIDSVEAPVEIKGIVETHDPVIFTQEPEVQISILCPDPYFSSLTPVVINSYVNNTISPLYFGSAGVGFLFELFVNRNVSMVTLMNGFNPDIVYGGSLEADDRLTINTNRGTKAVLRRRNSITTDGLDDLLSGSLSMVLETRTPQFYVKVDGASDIPFRLTFTPKYLGI